MTPSSESRRLLPMTSFACEIRPLMPPVSHAKPVRSAAVGGRGGTFLEALADNPDMRRLLWALAHVECCAVSHCSPASKLLMPDEAEKAGRLVRRASTFLESRAESREPAGDSKPKQFPGDA